ncbi:MULTISPECIES: glycosyltransferase [Butyricimonas]|uniref:glycosyltransferase n=1 Tax=Butyricimonas TaxID=574697 RepID=UPI001D068E1D|nr:MULTISPECIES: glycosyltransferase [Butyricimonas]MCB6972384.1 glycosyltransferase [Butyricimonas synergistica]MCG4519392.1 glycosyltransferase [Butyricimonas sp. DFI.6.44]
MEQIKVSIIIPVYNTEQYVKQTVESIMEQTLHDIEIIIINDGSTDNSLSVITELAKQDHRIKLLSQINQGQSISRNVGIEKASGEFIYFMDSDDLLEKNTLEICYQKCTSEQLDFVFFDADSFTDEASILRNYRYQRNLQIEDRVWSGIEILKIQDETANYRTSPCLSFTRLSYLQENNIQFYPHIIHEDELYTAMLYLTATRVKYIKQIFFKRRIRKDSITTRKFSIKNIQGYFTVANELKRYKKQKMEVAQIIDTHLSNMLNAAIWNASYLPLKERLYIAKCSIFDYFKYVSFKTIEILLFKSFFKK